MPVTLEQLAPHFHLPYYPEGEGQSDDSSHRQNSAVFLDRDGVIIEDVDYLTKSSQLIILPGAADAIRLLAPKHYVIVVTNQSAVGRGYLSEEDLLGIHTELLNRLFRNSARVDGLIYCPHHPTMALGSYKLDCDCRKPKAGMLRQAAAQWDLDLSGSFFIGDRESDIKAAITAGVKSFLVGDNPILADTPTTRVSDLLQAANIILDQDHG